MKVNKFTSGLLFLALFLFSLSGSVNAQIFGHGAEISNPTYDAKLFKDLKYRNIGPYRGGRSIAVSSHDSQPFTFYTGFAGGGVFKTIDGGNTWKPVSDGFFKTAAVGALEVAPSDPNVIYAGMGETDIRGNISAGDGLYKSTDAGKTWAYMGLGKTEFIGDIKIHPTNPDIIWVSALGQIFGNEGNEERGVYKSVDGGKTFKKVLFKNNKTGAIHVALDRNNPRILFATLWEAYRNPWEMSSGGEHGGIYKSTDGGDTWTEITSNPGLPKGLLGKMRLEISPANSNRIFAMIENENGGLFRSDDGGDTWQLVSSDRNLRQRAWYYTRAVADPKNEDVVYVLNVGFWKSIDGGRTFSRIGTPHGDHHDLWISPSDPNRMIIADDGGGQVSYNGGKSWSSYYTSATAQFYHVITDNQFPYLIYGAQQDNSTVAIRSRTSGANIGDKDWWPVAGGESGYIAPDPTNPNVTYGGSYGGFLNKFDAEIQLSKRIDVWPDNPMGAGAEDAKYRFQWTFPIMISPHDSGVLYTTSQHVHRSTDKGMSWETISADLTRNDKSKQGESGGPITKDDTSVEYYNTIFAFTESPVQKGVLWAGADDGLIHISRDNGKTWNNVTPKGMPEAMVSIIDASHHNAGTAYVAANRYKFNDFTPMLYKTTDFGNSWTKINNGIPEMAFTRAIREDPNKKGLLYAGTETGMFVSFDDGAKWQSLRLNMPAVAVTDIAVHKRDKDLIVATQGRAFYVLDDLTVLHEMSDKVTKADHYFFKPETAYLFGSRGWWGGQADNVGENPDMGVSFFYNLKNKVNEEIRLELYDPRGTEIRTFSSTKNDKGKPLATSDKFYKDETKVPSTSLANLPGLNKFVWDFQYPEVTRLNGPQILWSGNTNGPRAIPGTYSAKLYVGDKLVGEQPFTIVKDPRLVDVSQADFEAQFELASVIKAKLSETHESINKIREVRAEINKISAEAKDNKDIQARAKGMLEAMDEIENALMQTKAEAGQDLLNFKIKLNNKLASLAGTVETGHGRPTKQQYEVYEDLAAQVDVQLVRLQKIWDGEYSTFKEGAGGQYVPIKN
ncbi:MAG: glycosyl hydrolase [Balneolaceae bacterium]